MIGPFPLFEQFGPVLMKSGQGIDVRPHPHIGLSTVTWLFDGAIFHRDSLGSEQPIAPGELNWMTAGRGIVHSERTSPAELSRERTVFGIQSWVALPKQHEETAPGFEHVAMDRLPVIADRGLKVRVIAGQAYGATSPVKTHSGLFYLDVQMAPGASLPLPVEHEERGVYVAEGAVEVAGGAGLRGRPPAGVPPGRCHHAALPRWRPSHAARRRADGRPTPHLVEFRLLLKGPHRGRQGRLEACPLRRRAG